MKKYPEWMPVSKTSLTRLLFLALIISISSDLSFSAPPGKNARTDSLEDNSAITYKAIAYGSAYYAGSMLLLSNTWYKDKRTVPFHFYDDNRGICRWINWDIPSALMSIAISVTTTSLTQDIPEQKLFGMVQHLV
jgi:hypothetical protein